MKKVKAIKKDRLKLAFCEGLQRIGAKLHMGPSTLATMGFQLVNEDGSIALDMTAKSNSFVRNYYNYVAMTSIFKSAGNADGTTVGTFGDGIHTPIKNTAGALHYSTQNYTIDNQNIETKHKATIGDSTKGIVVGLSDAAESFDSYALTSKIAHGTGVNQLQLGAGQAVPSYSFNSATKKLTAAHTRPFTNASSEDVIIKEIGLYCFLGLASSSLTAMFIRDVIPEGITVAPGQTLNVTYNLSQIMSN